ncbi:MAG: GDP-mannose 4,6-dehydratase, partial [Microcystis sp.]
LVKLMVDADLAALGINLNNGGDCQQLLKDLAYLRNRSLIAVD